MNIHEGHRERLKKRFFDHGLDNFDDINALELLLFYALPRRDTNELAHRLLKRFGTLAGVMDASKEDLLAVEGVGENVAGLLRLIPALSRRYVVSKTPSAEPVDTPTQAGRYFIPHFMYETEEVVLALLLDARRRPILCQELGRGTVNAAEVSARKLAALCLERKASAVIVAHNHPTGDPQPSFEDKQLTKSLKNAGEIFGIPLMDHLVIGDGYYYSFKEHGDM